MEWIIIIMCWCLYGFAMHMSGENVGYMKGYEEAYKELTERYKL